MKGRSRSAVLLAVMTAVVISAFSASSAFAVTAGELATGTTTGSLALTAGTGAVFATNFSPGNTASQTGLLTATDTSPSWTLQVQDNAASGAGHMKAGTLGCTGSDAQLANPLDVTVNSLVPGVTSAGSKSISGSAQTVASSTSALLAANLLTTNYSQVIPSSEIMLAGCVYTMTATYTLQ